MSMISLDIDRYELILIFNSITRSFHSPKRKKNWVFPMNMQKEEKFPIDCGIFQAREQENKRYQPFGQNHLFAKSNSPNLAKDESFQKNVS